MGQNSGSFFSVLFFTGLLVHSKVEEMLTMVWTLIRAKTLLGNIFGSKNYQGYQLIFEYSIVWNKY